MGDSEVSLAPPLKDDDGPEFRQEVPLAQKLKFVREEIDPVKVAAHVADKAFYGLTAYGEIPEKFRNPECKLDIAEVNLDDLATDEIVELLENPDGTIYNPHWSHRAAIALFQKFCDGDLEFTYPVAEGATVGDSMRPRYGGILVGPSGVGKTHIMAAYAIHMKKIMQGRLDRLNEHIATRVVEIYWDFYQAGGEQDMPQDAYDLDRLDEYESGQPKKSPLQIRDEALEHLVVEARMSPTKPIDILFMPFRDLWELYIDESRKEARVAIEKAPMLFVDDVHPEEDRDKAHVIKDIIEGRYAQGRRATYITSNCTVDGLMGMVGERDEVVSRLLDRCQETFLQIDFTGAVNWRHLIREHITSRPMGLITDALAEQGHLAPVPEDIKSSIGDYVRVYGERQGTVFVGQLVALDDDNMLLRGYNLATAHAMAKTSETNQALQKLADQQNLELSALLQAPSRTACEQVMQVVGQESISLFRERIVGYTTLQ